MIISAINNCSQFLIEKLQFRTIFRTFFGTSWHCQFSCDIYYNLLRTKQTWFCCWWLIWQFSTNLLILVVIVMSARFFTELIYSWQISFLLTLQTCPANQSHCSLSNNLKCRMLDKTLNVFQVREMEMANHCQFRASWRFSEWNYGLVFHHDISQDISNGRNKYSI